jgi:hypothetical protein
MFIIAGRDPRDRTTREGRTAAESSTIGDALRFFYASRAGCAAQ